MPACLPACLPACQVVVPRMYPELTTQRVLVMDWVEGTRLVDSKDVELVEVRALSALHCTTWLGG